MLPCKNIHTMPAFRLFIALLLILLSGVTSAQEGLPIVNMTSGADGEVQYS